MIKLVENKLDEEDFNAIELVAALLKMQLGEEVEEMELDFRWFDSDEYKSRKRRSSRDGDSRRGRGSDRRNDRGGDRRNDRSGSRRSDRRRGQESDTRTNRESGRRTVRDGSDKSGSDRRRGLMRKHTEQGDATKDSKKKSGKRSRRDRDAFGNW